MKFKMSLLLLLAILCHYCMAQNAGSSADERIRRLDSFFNVLEQHKLINGGVLIAEHGKIIYCCSLGSIDNEYGRINSDTSSFNLASLSKPFTAIAVLQLVQKGKLHLADPVADYLTDFPYPSVTIRHLLNHTSGLPNVDDFERPYIVEHPGEIITSPKAYEHLLALKQPLHFQPGGKWSYSNMGYIVLALLVEKVAKTPFDIYMKKNIFLPAGMKSSYVRKPDMSNTYRYIIPTMYDSTYQHVDSLNPNKIYTYYHLGSTYGPSNIVSTLQDLLKFDNALLQGKLISDTLLKEAFAYTKLNNGNTFYMGRSTRSYGLGWNVYHSKTTPADEFVFHDGHIIGLNTVLHHNLTKQQTIIMYDNTDGFAFLTRMVNISNILNNIPPQPISTATSLARVYGQSLVQKGPDYAMSRLNELKDDSAHYYMDELEMNRLGYDLLNIADFKDHVELAVEVFKINTILYPKSSNVYDSYAEALMKAGKKEEAVNMFRKTLILNPGNEAAKKNLKQLMANN